MNNSRIPTIKNANFSGHHLYMNTNIKEDFQICIIVTLSFVLEWILSIKKCSVFHYFAISFWKIWFNFKSFSSKWLNFPLMNSIRLVGKSLKELRLSLYTIRNEISYKWLISLWTPMLWNIWTEGQQPSHESMNAFVRIISYFLYMKFGNLVKTESFFQAFLFKQATYSSKLKILSIYTTNSFCFLVFGIAFKPYIC